MESVCVGDDEMSTVKDDLRQLLDQLPDDVSYEDVHYHLYVRQKIQRGLQDVREGKVLSQEELDERTRRWLRE